MEGFEGCGQGGSIHCEERCDCRHAGWFGAVEGHHERELAVCQVKGAERVVEAACECPCRSLEMKTETGVANQERGLEGRVRGV